MKERMEILHHLQQRKIESYTGTPCPSCGNDNKCSMDAGHSSSTCWCMTNEIAGHINIAPDENCYCKSCLDKMEIEE